MNTRAISVERLQPHGGAGVKIVRLIRFGLRNTIVATIGLATKCRDARCPTALMVALFAATVATQSVGRAQTTRAEQERASEMTQELIADTLNTQLRRLDENGLQHVPLRGEVAAVRDQLSRIATTDMQNMLRLLPNDQRASDQAGPPQVAERRDLARRIIIQLMAERQRIRKRLRVAETAGQVTRLIELQFSAREGTEQLEASGTVGRSERAAEVLHDQEDVSSLLGQLVETLGAIANWGGSIGATAREAADLCQRDDILAVSKRAANRIRNGSFRGAVPEQQQVLNTLYATLRSLERAQGLAAVNRAAALRLIQRLVSEQTRIQQESRTARFLEDTLRDRLSADQRVVQRQIDSLHNIVRDKSQLSEQIDRAANYSRAAETALFNAQQSLTIDAQQGVLDALRAAAQELRAAEEVDSSDGRQPNQAALRDLDRTVDEALELQSQATGMAETNPRGAAAIERQVSQQLESTETQGDYSEPLEGLLDSAQDAVANAERLLSQSGQQDASAQQQAASQAEQSLLELAAEIKSNLPPNDASQQSDGQPTADQPEAAGESTPSPDQTSSNENNSDAQEGMAKSNAAGSQDEHTQFDSRTGEDKQDTSVAGRDFRDSSWFMNLPASLRKAVEARSRRPPPPEYAERLERYFRQ